MKQALIFYIVFIAITKEIIVLNEKLLVAIAFLIVLGVGQRNLSSMATGQLEARTNLIKQQYEEYFNSQKAILVELANFHRVRAGNCHYDTANDILRSVSDLIAKIKTCSHLNLLTHIQTKLSGHLESIKTEEGANLVALQKELLNACVDSNPQKSGSKTTPRAIERVRSEERGMS